MRIIFLIGYFLVLVSFSCTQDLDFEHPVWFSFQPYGKVLNSEIDASSWLGAPAGKHGYLQNIGDKFVFNDGTEVKFWGVNICSQWPYTEPEKVNQWVQYLARYGVNAVRFHKFSSHGLMEDMSTEISPEKYEKLDFFHAKLKEKGIYYSWSHIYGHKPKPGDSTRLVNYKEVVSTKFPWAHLNGSTASIVNFARDLQDLNIELTVNMLHHKNSFTGLTYAEDPALICIELQNEDNIFWGAMEETLSQTPTYRTMLCRQFSEWLTEKYKTQKMLELAWGKLHIPQGESLQKKNIYPQPNHHVFTAEYIKCMEEKRPIAQHFLDKAQFLFETQMNYYNRFTDSIRASGYKGTIVASCWQAGSGITHYYNLLADYNSGLIDRHNYFGGGTGHRLVPGPVKNEAMVSQPGSGLLSIGMQQVKDRPFVFSEWMSLMPNEWTAEAAPIIAVYGMGLQGWDASFAFASNDYKISNGVQANSHGVYNVESPIHVTIYPTLSRMIFRGDIQEAPDVALRKISFQDLSTGQLRFSEQIQQDHDRKYISGDFPSYLLSYGKVPIDFSEDTYQLTDESIPRYGVGDTIASITGQLQWMYDKKGYFIINSEGTQGVVGFAGGQIIDLQDVSLDISTPFSVILLTSLEKNTTLLNADKILITTIARAKNTDMKYNADKTQLLNVGGAPVLMEPVQASIRLKAHDHYRISILDHMGVKTKMTVPERQGIFLLDGSKYSTIYYLVERVSI